MITLPVLVASASITAAVWLLRFPQRLPLDAPSGPSRAANQLAQPAFLVGLLAGAGVGWALLGGALGVGVGAVAGLVGARWLLGLTPSGDVRKQKLIVQQYPLVLGLVARVVESGAPVRYAAEAVCQVVDGPGADALRGVVASCDVGFTDAEAWRGLAQDPVWGDVARELARCVDTGAATGRVLDSAAERATKAADAQAIIQARSVGVTSALPLVCCFLPAFLLVGVVPIIGGLVGNFIKGF